MLLRGYARASTADQDLGLLEATAQAEVRQVVRAEKRDGARRGGRAGLVHLASLTPVPRPPPP
jgi:DNA invertase Pin-like site-specific DNA recombinase